MMVYYTYSLRRLGYDYLKHPSFFDYACGVMAHPDGPDYLLSDTECLAEFPAKVLPGLVDGIHWRPVQPPAPLSKERMGKRSREELLTVS